LSLDDWLAREPTIDEEETEASDPDLLHDQMKEEK
jgi:hypothetical protein